jgi:hypothetical protein
MNPPIQRIYANKSGKKKWENRALVTQACNPSYLGDRDQEDCSSKSAPGNSSRDPISNPISKELFTHTKRAGRVAQSIGCQFKPQYHKKKKSRKK